ncbi:MAG: hypothetical protein ACRD4P_03835, partial [Bryobacteraceae bacterium]
MTSSRNGGAKRVLALDLRPGKAGFAVFEGTQLLDWGVTMYGKQAFETTVRRRITRLLDLHSPDLAVLLRRRARSANAAEALTI